MTRMPLVVLVAAVALGLATGVTAVVAGSRGDDSPPPAAAAGVEGEAVAVLRDWDARRARAYARGDPATLADLYADGSRTGRADVRVLRGYLARHLTVTGMRTQLLAVDVLRRTDRRLLVEVTDVLAGAVARSGSRRWALPRDRPSTRRVELVREAGAWRVVEAYVVE